MSIWDFYRECCCEIKRYKYGGQGSGINFLGFSSVVMVPRGRVQRPVDYLFLELVRIHDFS